MARWARPWERSYARRMERVGAGQVSVEMRADTAQERSSALSDGEAIRRAPDEVRILVRFQNPVGVTKNVGR